MGTAGALIRHCEARGRFCGQEAKQSPAIQEIASAPLPMGLCPGPRNDARLMGII